MTAATLTLLVAALLTGVLSTIVVALLARAAGVGVPEVGLGVWGPRFRFYVGHTRVTLTPWIFSCWTTVKEPHDIDRFPDTPGKSFDQVHPLVRVLIVLAGPLAIVALATPVLGMSAFHSLLTGFRQVLEGAAGPTLHAQQLLSGFASVADASLSTAAAVLMTKCAAFMLLPFPSLPGGNALVQLLRWRNPAYPPRTTSLVMVGLLLVVVVTAAWAFALIWFLLG